ncbi:hypothetical protein IT774_00150 [Salinimonas marina]|uniref:GEVED domain-containing protein n=1 Tax=Salinimonas marina TaxID=2785918 RepID=A0A7S9DXH8_9ALTE|nr:hypothetical protein [Salinimonas marina]QPG05744.1 hypothetical protein IT774_00150 [Salinimonas marina]
MKIINPLILLAMTVFVTACGGSDAPDPKTSQQNNISDKASSDESDNADGDDISSDSDGAAGSDDSGSEAPAPSISGKVIDGYVSGATVWIDFNNNGVFDDDEPSAVSEAAGNYTLELTDTQQQCAAYATVYVDVPVGAMDEDLGEVTEAYQMVRPPQMAVLDDDSLLHVSPLTTVLWQGIQDALNGSDFSDCETLLTDQAKRQEVQALVDDTIGNTVSLYNISAETIFRDFIADENDEAKALAQQFVKGLQQSFAHTQTVKAAYPQASEVRVVHYFGHNPYYTDDDEPHWFRDVVVFNGDEFIARDDLMNDELSEVLTPIYYRDSLDTAWGDGLLTATKDTIYNGDGGGFRCSLSEQVSITQADVTYALQNYLPEGQQAATADGCENQSFVNTTPRRIFYITYDEANKSYLADLRQEDGTVTVLPHWVGFAEASDQFDFAELVAELEVSGYRFDEPVTIPTSSWAKRQTWDEGDIRYQIDYDSTGQWLKTTTQADGTYTTECSYDEGTSWEACRDA